MDRRFERAPQVRARIGISQATLYRWVAAGQFPAPVRLHTRTTAWAADEIDRWMAQRMAARKQAA
ncbi:helix-turn-helix transcriptional regulator [Dokdonella soli]|uniref:helix-turn-helix transcriptional regulator n=1 Tax=Dokdonella soli TaxID=529810 RepID=UPI0031E2DC19